MSQYKKLFSLVFGTLLTAMYVMLVFWPGLSPGLKILPALLAALFGYGTYAQYREAPDKKAEPPKIPPLTWRETFWAGVIWAVVGLVGFGIWKLAYWAFTTPLTLKEIAPTSVGGWLVLYWLLKHKFKRVLPPENKPVPPVKNKQDTSLSKPGAEAKKDST